MKSGYTLAVLTVAALTLAGCVETGGAGGGQMAPDPSGPPFIEGTFSASDAAVKACRKSLASQTTGGVRVVGSETSEAAHAVYMRVGANGAPWRCLVSPNGRNPSLMFMGNEGTL